MYEQISIAFVVLDTAAKLLAEIIDESAYRVGKAVKVLLTGSV